MYFSNSQASRLLPMPGRPDDRHEPGARLARGRVEQVLEQPELVVAADERRLERAPTGRARRDRRRHAGPATPARGLALALQRVLAERLERDRPRGGPLGRLADQHGAGRCDRLEPRGRVHEVAGDHALPVAAEGHGRLAGQDPGAEQAAGRRVRGSCATASTQVERGADRPLGVVLVGDRCAPDRHDRVADELLDGPAVALDDRPGEREVGVEELPDVLRVAVSDADVKPTRSANRTLTSRRSDDAAAGSTALPSRALDAAGSSVERAPVVGVPHSGQNRAPTGRAAPHAVQAASWRAPHSGQKRWPGWISCPQL